MRAPRFEVFAGKSGWYWRLRSRNGEIIAQSERYPTRRGAMFGVGAVRRAAVVALLKEAS